MHLLYGSMERRRQDHASGRRGIGPHYLGEGEMAPRLPWEQEMRGSSPCTQTHGDVVLNGRTWSGILGEIGITSG
jgi:hypothetical protein